MVLEIVRLLLFLFWGMVLAVLYLLFAKLAWRIQGRCGLLILLSLGAAILLLLVTILFTIMVSNGEIGLYSVPSIIAGFYLYYHFLRQPLESFFAPIGQALGAVCGWILRGLLAIMGLIFWPLDKIVRGLEALCRLALSPWYRRRRRRLRRRRKRQKQGEDTLFEQEDESW